MSRLVAIIGLAALFLGWVLYRLFITRDLAQHKETLILGLLFVGVWALLFTWLFW